ncbi:MULTISPECIES: UxaA family hydrolase [unclassified Archaeoglobus]|jgi:altronate dehydratase small subunit|uniref:UxaA family hydrolase n=1 Tax=unclassified Archaeoglobus TaxID=2643606 RepID=UPI0025BE4897|nr:MULTISPECIES: UxaA family hydrolase [unclassified Archaeoglobus]
MYKKVHIHDKRDNVAVALEDLKPGDKIKVNRNGAELEIEVKQEIPFGHKVALERIQRGGEVIKYGETIGVATEDIAEGEHVHIHNLRSLKYS